MINSSESCCDHNQADWFRNCYVLGVCDGRLAESKAEITIQCHACDVKFVIVLNDVYVMSVQNFWENNIIENINQYMWADMPVDMLVALLRGGDIEELRSKHNLWLDKIRDEKMILYHVTPSCGCEILALCKSITLRELTES